MAKKEKKEVVKETTEENVTKVKAKMKKPSQDMDVESVTKVDFSKPPKPKEDEVEKSNADDSGVVASAEDANAPQEQEKVQPEGEAQETQVVEEITNEVAEVADKVVEAIEVAEQLGTALPEGIQKVVDFMEETGGDLNDYVKLNKDYSEMDNQTVLEEYYKKTKPHLTGDEIDFLMEDNFSYDEDIDEDRDIKRKKLALKEQVANARQHLDGLKSKYYDEIKSGSKLTDEQKEAVNFYNEQRATADSNEIISNDFINKTNKFFGDQFKGFEYEVGDKRFRYNVANVSKVKESQKDINQFIGKFLDNNGKMNNESEYHKSLFTAMNADAIANHFYEQGKADATKTSIAESKNIDMNPRQELNQGFDGGGIKMRALDTEQVAQFKFTNKNK
mgnify:FL=1|tara:strand:- start:1171 stop:2340 length:1170 start_codon:yes stop_codon:yes gene_type:complete